MKFAYFLNNFNLKWEKYMRPFFHQFKILWLCHQVMFSEVQSDSNLLFYRVKKIFLSLSCFWKFRGEGFPADPLGCGRARHRHTQVILYHEQEHVTTNYAAQVSTTLKIFWSIFLIGRKVYFHHSTFRLSLARPLLSCSSFLMLQMIATLMSLFIYLLYDNLATGGSLTCAILWCHVELSKYSTSK